MECEIAYFFHILGIRGTLGVDVEHDKAVVAVGVRDPFDGFERIVEMIGMRRRGIDADTDKRFCADRAEKIPIFLIGIRHVDPFFPIVTARLRFSRKRVGKG